MTIEGPGADALAVDGNQASRVFDVESGVTASVAGLTVQNGGAETGAGIRNAGMLTLTASMISGNETATPNGFGGGNYTRAR